MLSEAGQRHVRPLAPPERMSATDGGDECRCGIAARLQRFARRKCVICYAAKKCRTLLCVNSLSCAPPRDQQAQEEV